MSLGGGQPERRRAKRFPLCGKALALMRPGPGPPGRVVRISIAAAEVVYEAPDGVQAPETRELDILVAGFTRGVYLRRVPVATLSDRPVEPPAPVAGASPRRRVVAFGGLTGVQRGELQSFIEECAL